MKISTAFVAAMALAATTTVAAADSKIKAEVAQPTITVSSQGAPIGAFFANIPTVAFIGGTLVVVGAVSLANNSGSH